MNTNKYKLMSIILYIIKALLIFSIFKYIGNDKLSSCEAGMITIVVMILIILCDLFYKSNIKEQKCECDEPFFPVLDIPNSKPYKFEHFTPTEEVISEEHIYKTLTKPNVIPITTPIVEQPTVEHPTGEQIKYPKSEHPISEQKQPNDEIIAEKPILKKPVVEKPSVEIIVNKNKITQEQEQEQEQQRHQKIPLNDMLSKYNRQNSKINESESEIEIENEQLQKRTQKIPKKNPKIYMEEEEDEIIYNKKQKQKFFSPYATVENNYIINDVELNDYNHLPVPEDYDTNLYEYGYSFLPPEKWYPQPPNPPVCVTSKRCSVCPSLSQGTPVDVKEWNTSRKITGPIKIDNRNFD